MTIETEPNQQEPDNAELHRAETPEADPVWRFVDFVEQGADSPEQDKAKELLTMWREASRQDIVKCSESFAEFFKGELPERYKGRAAPEDMRKTLTRAKLFHLLAGSSMPSGKFEKLPLDLPDGGYSRFIRGLA